MLNYIFASKDFKQDIWLAGDYVDLWMIQLMLWFWIYVVVDSTTRIDILIFDV